MSYLLAAIGILGLWIAGSGNKYGWVLGIFAQFLWAFYAISTHQYGFLISCAGYGFVYVRNFIKGMRSNADDHVNDGSTREWEDYESDRAG